MSTTGQMIRINSGLLDFFLTDDALYVYREGSVTTSILLVVLGLLIGFLYTGLLIGIALGLIFYLLYSYLVKRKGARVKSAADVESLYQAFKVRKFNWNELVVDHVNGTFRFHVTDADGKAYKYSFRVSKEESSYITQRVPK